MPVSQYEIYTDASTYIVCNLIAESRMWCQMFPAPRLRKTSCSEYSWNTNVTSNWMWGVTPMLTK